MAQLQKLLWSAERPFVIAGGSRWSEAAVAGLQRFAERFDLPVGCSFRRQMLFDHAHPNYAGDVGIGINPALAARRQGGGRAPPHRRADGRDAVVELFADRHPGTAADAGPCPPRRRGARPRLPPGARHQCQSGRLRRGARRHPAAARRDRLGRRDAAPPTPPIAPGRRRAGTRARCSSARSSPGCRERLPDDAIITNGAGNYSGWVHRFFRFRRYGTQLAPTSGSMGYGLPAAIAAKLRHPERTVVAFAGDGCFQMTSQEFATAVQYGAAVIVVLVNNGIHGTIRMHQERDYPGRVIATDLVNPDFAALARAYGGHGETVATTEDVRPRLRARAAQRANRRSSRSSSTRRRSPAPPPFPPSAARAGDRHFVSRNHRLLCYIVAQKGVRGDRRARKFRRTCPD